MKSTGTGGATGRSGQGEGEGGGAGAETAAGWAPPRRGARGIGQFVENLTRAAFARYGFSAAVILTQWAAIVGPELAAYTAPERLMWPRRANSDDEGDEERPRGRSGATLVLRVNGPRAVEIQHRYRELLERVNAAFGYRAVGQIRIVQAPVDRQAATAWRRRLASTGGGGGRSPKPPPAVPEGVENDRLRAALERMARGVASRQGA